MQHIFRFQIGKYVYLELNYIKDLYLLIICFNYKKCNGNGQYYQTKKVVLNVM